MVTAVAVRAAGAPSGEAAKSGPWGLAIILLLCLACYFLFKSMSKHMRKVREQFPTEPRRPGPAGAPPGRPAPPGPGDAAPPPAAEDERHADTDGPDPHDPGGPPPQ